MTLYQIKNFLIVAEKLNFHKASEQILIAQPALSRQIQQLEQEIGALLFDRSKKQIRLTNAGAYFKREAARLVLQIEEAVKQSQKIYKGEVMDIRIGHASSAMQSVLPKILKGIKKDLPGIQATLIEGTNKLIFEKLLHHELDFGIVPNAITSKELKSKVLYRENFVLVLPSDHPLTRKTFKNLSDCAEDDWIMPPGDDGLGYVEILYRIFQKHNFLPKVVHRTPNASSALRLVEAGLGVNVIGKSALNGVNLEIKHIELSKIGEKVEMRLVWLKEREPELSNLINRFGRYA